MEGNSIRELKNTAVDLRKHVIDMIYKAQSGHPGGSLSVADFVTACYFQEMRVDPKNPKWRTETGSSCRRAMCARPSMRPWP